MAEKLASLRKKGGRGIEWFDDDKYFDGTQLQNFTNGGTYTLVAGKMVIFNCKKYSQCYNSSTIGCNIYGVNPDSIIYIGGAGTNNVADCDYIICARSGTNNSMPFYFS